MDRRDLIRFLFSIPCLVMCGSDVNRAIGADRPVNVLLIAVDDLRPELGCYGTAEVISPNIDRLAEQGVQFSRAYVQQSVCGPSRISLLSGLRPDSTGVLRNNVMLRDARPDVVSLPRHFNLHGYRTVSLGKVFHHPEDDPAAWSDPDWRPFQISYGWRNYRRAENLELVQRLHSAYPPEKQRVIPLGRVKGPAFEAMPVPDNVYPDGLTADMAIRTLGSLAYGDVPFFLAIGFEKPHLPFECPQSYWDLYDPSQISLAENDRPPTGMPKVAFRDSDELRQYSDVPPEGPIADGQARHLIHGYRACVTYVDAQIGRVVDELDRLGLTDDTVIVLWGDHGWHLGEQGIWAKATNFENAVRIPLVIRPGRAVNSRPSKPRALVEAVDIYPTLCELAGIPKPAHLEGTSMVPVLRKPDRPWKTAAFSQYPRPDSGPDQVMGRSMRTDRYRFSRWAHVDHPDQVLAYELYDHESDPNETQNIADQVDAEEIRNLESQLLAGWRDALPKGLPRSMPSELSPDENESRFVSLFNGRDLTGWDGRPGCWTVRDGAITSTGLGKERNWLIWRGSEASDFELRLNFRFSRGNSGVQVRSHDLGNWQVRGYQVEVAAREAMGLWHHSLMAADEPLEAARKFLATAGQRVAIAADGSKVVEQRVPAEKVQSAFLDDQWNELVVIARGPELVQTINGVVFAELTDLEDGFAARNGVIALQDHGKGTIAEFKNIRIRFDKTLSPATKRPRP